MLRDDGRRRAAGRSTPCAASSGATRSCRWIRTSSSSRRSSSRCSRRRRRAGSSTGSSSARCRAGPSGDNFHNNIAYAPGMWIALHRICERHGVGDQFRVHYDPSHAILMGQDTRSIFQYLKDAGYDFIDRRLPRQGAGDRPEGRRGLGLRRPDRRARRLGERQAVAESRRPRATRGRSRPCCASTSCPGTAKHDPLGYLQNRTVDWLDHQLAARELLEARRREHRARHRARVPAGAHPGQGAAASRSCKGSIAFARKIDEAAACMYALQHEVLPAQEIPVQGRGRVAYWT